MLIFSYNITVLDHVVLEFRSVIFNISVGSVHKGLWQLFIKIMGPDLHIAQCFMKSKDSITLKQLYKGVQFYRPST